MPETQSIALVVSALDSLVKTVTNLLGIAEQNIDAAYRINDKVTARQEQKQIDSLLHDFTMVSRSQGILPTYLVMEAVRLEDPDRLNDGLDRTRRQVAATAVDLTAMIERIHEQIGHRHSAALERAPELLDGLLQAMNTRQTILRELKALAEGDIVLHPEDAPLLRKMAQDYQQLRSALQQYRGQLARLAEKLED